MSKFLEIFLVVLFLYKSTCSSDDVCTDTCNNPKIKSNLVQHYCKSHNLTIVSRCCYLEGNMSTIEAADFSSCNLKTFPSSFYNNSVFKNLKILDVSDNQFDLLTISPINFSSFIQLDSLIIPQIPTSNTTNCPGGRFSWRSMEIINPQTIHCHDRKGVCYTKYPFSNCSKTSECVEDGPGLFNCSCSFQFHGYRCLIGKHLSKLAISLFVLIPALLIIILDILRIPK
ncbi:hypothetical protein SNEBB_011192 [Seison nebaliae]|nr:hypothetical protein SNEBB_011192 [Seison nebaliae]